MMKFRNLMIALLVAAFALVGCGDDTSSSDDSTLNISEPDAGDEDASEINDADNDPEPDSGDEPDSDPEPDPDQGSVSCESNDECVEVGEYCQRLPGCDVAGNCEPIPDEACGEAETPYCDCEGNVQTSPNTCIWAPSQPMEQCEEEGEKEGCELNEDCPVVGQYCERAPGCDALGECVDIPIEQCNAVVTPYCDCEGNAKQSSSSCIYEPYMAEGTCSM